MKKFTIQVILLLLIIAIGMFYYLGGAKIIPIPFLPQAPQFQQVTIKDITINIEVADNQSKRSKGLSDRASLASDSGMLFVFEREDKYPFWMKGLNFPLDFIWIKGNSVVDISENIQPPPPGAPDASLPILTANTEVDKVLEVAAGFVKTNKVKIGDKVELK